MISPTAWARRSRTAAISSPGVPGAVRGWFDGDPFCPESGTDELTSRSSALCQVSAGGFVFVSAEGSVEVRSAEAIAQPNGGSYTGTSMMVAP